MKVDMSGRVVFLTAGAGAIGSRIAYQFGSNGAKVYMGDIADERGGEIAASLRSQGYDVNYRHCNIRENSEVKAYVDEILAKEGKIDILLNNAGWNVGGDRRGNLPDYAEDDVELVMGICMDGVYSATKYILPQMIKNGYGRIVNTGSVTGFRIPLKYQAVYNQAKHAIINLTRSMALEYGKYGIRVNSVIPGSVVNEQIINLIWGTEERKKSMLEHIAVGRPGKGDDIACAILYACSDEADFLNGTLINVDGGWGAGYVY